MPDAIGELGLDIKPFEQALATVNAELADTIIESKKLNAEIALLERAMFNAGGGTKAQAKELRELKTVAEDFAVQIKAAKVEQKAFQQVTEETTESTKRASEETGKLSISFGRLIQIAGGFIGLETLRSFFSKLTDTREETQKFNEEVAKLLSGGNGAGEYSQSGGIESRIKGIDSAIDKLSEKKGALKSAFEFISSAHILGGEGYDAVIAKQDQQSKDLLEQKVKLQTQLAERTANETQVLELKLQRDEYEAELLKNHLHYHELIGKAIEDGNSGLVFQLKTQEKISEELIKQKNLDAQHRAASANAGDQAKTAIGALLGDQENHNKIDDREADKKQSDLDFFHDQERKKGEEALEYDAKKKKDESDFFHAQERKMAEGALRWEAENQKKQQQEREQAQKNANEADRARIETGIGNLRAGGNSLGAQELEIRQRYTDRKAEAAKNGNDDLVKELDKQQEQALRGVRNQEAHQRPRDRIHEADNARHQATGASRQDAREAELRRRAATGAHSKAIDDQITKDDIKKKQDAQVDQAKKDHGKDPQSEYLKSAAADLKVIREQLTISDD